MRNFECCELSSAFYTSTLMYENIFIVNNVVIKKDVHWARENSNKDARRHVCCLSVCFTLKPGENFYCARRFQLFMK